MRCSIKLVATVPVLLLISVVFSITGIIIPKWVVSDGNITDTCVGNSKELLTAVHLGLFKWCLVDSNGDNTCQSLLQGDVPSTLPTLDFIHVTTPVLITGVAASFICIFLSTMAMVTAGQTDKDTQEWKARRIVRMTAIVLCLPLQMLAGSCIGAVICIWGSKIPFHLYLNDCTIPLVPGLAFWMLMPPTILNVLCTFLVAFL